MAATSVVLQIIVTGICAIVPSAKDKDVTRLIAPNEMKLSSNHPKIPEHFAFIEVHAKNYREEGREPDFRYHNYADMNTAPSSSNTGDPVQDKKPDDDRLVFILGSEEVEL